MTSIPGRVANQSNRQYRGLAPDTNRLCAIAATTVGSWTSHDSADRDRGFDRTSMLGIGGLMTTIGPWYRDLRKPVWNPPNWVFGPAWTVILGLAAWSGVLAWAKASLSTEHVRIFVLFGINIVLHMLWTRCSSICDDPIGL